MIPDRVEAIKQFLRLHNLHRISHCVGMVGFNVRFIPNFWLKVALLHLLKLKGAWYEWWEEKKASFKALKQASYEVPVLQVPDFDKQFVLVNDASDMVMLAVLNQCLNGHLAPVSFYNILLIPAEWCCSTYVKKCLPVLSGCEKARNYQQHKEFGLHCDNNT